MEIEPTPKRGKRARNARRIRTKQSREEAQFRRENAEIMDVLRIRCRRLGWPETDANLRAVKGFDSSPTGQMLLTLSVERPYEAAELWGVIFDFARTVYVYRRLALGMSATVSRSCVPYVSDHVDASDVKFDPRSVDERVEAATARMRYWQDMVRATGQAGVLNALIDDCYPELLRGGHLTKAGIAALQAIRALARVKAQREDRVQRKL